MTRITVICLGKLKEKYLRDAEAEYAKRLQSLCKLNIVELEPVRLPDNPSETQISAALAAEAEKISAKIPSGSVIIPMCIEGKQLPSEKLAERLERYTMEKGSITFIIGSSYGLSDTIKSKADYKLSMSEMTFPHQLARVMLLEQIYRSFRILTGGTYHK